MTGLFTQVATSAATSAAASAVQKRMIGAQPKLLAQAQGQSAPAAARNSIKRGESIALACGLAPVGGGAPLTSQTLRAQANANGDGMFTPLIGQVATALNPVPQAAADPSQAIGSPSTAAAAGGMRAASSSQSQHAGGWSGLFGARDKDAGKAAPASTTPPGSGMPDCAQIANMPSPPISLEACQKMAAARQAYVRAAADPGASRPGDEPMSCDQIQAEPNLQPYTARDKARAAAATTAANQVQALIRKHIASANVVMAEEKVKVDAAAVADQAAGMATGGLVHPNAAAAAAQAAEGRVRVVSERQAAERRPTEPKRSGGVADLRMDAAQQLSSSPRLARLMWLA